MAKKRKPPKDIDQLLTFAQVFDALEKNDWMPSFIEDLDQEEQRLIDGLRESCPDILERPNVKGIGVGFAIRRGTQTPNLAPIVFVSEKVQIEALKAEEAVPQKIEIDGKAVKTDVVVLGPFSELQCIAPGVPIENHQRYRPVRPGVAISAVFNRQPVTKGTGGAIVRRIGGDPTDPNDPLFLLSVRHVLSDQLRRLDIMQPWLGDPRTDIIGQTRVLLVNDDAGIASIEQGDPDIVCIGRPNPPLPPLVGMPVQKSGAGTGHTGSEIQYTKLTIPQLAGTNDFLVTNDASFPPPVPGGGAINNFATGGDSGALTVLGDPANPANFGQRINNVINRFLVFVPGMFRNTVRRLVQQRLQRSALGLTVSVAQLVIQQGTAFTAVRVARCLEIRIALDQLGVTLV